MSQPLLDRSEGLPLHLHLGERPGEVAECVEVPDEERDCQQQAANEPRRLPPNALAAQEGLGEGQNSNHQERGAGCLGPRAGGERDATGEAEKYASRIRAKRRVAENKKSERDRHERVVVDPVEIALGEKREKGWNDQASISAEDAARNKITEPDQTGDQRDVQETIPVRHERGAPNKRLTKPVPITGDCVVEGGLAELVV
jgi:hypothetical protein